MNLIVAYIAENAVRAHMVKNLLEDQGFFAAVDNEHLTGAYGDIPPGIHTSPRVMIRDEDAEAVTTILNETVFKPSPTGDGNDPTTEEEEEDDVEPTEEAMALGHIFFAAVLVLAAFVTLAAILAAAT